MEYINKKNGEIISEQSFNTLQPEDKEGYRPFYPEVQHTMGGAGDFALRSMKQFLGQKNRSEEQ